ncbi:SpoIIE family protein phosphatase [Azorhizobium doebereinerae]|uniref:SpoIIE family protein phosphatase n=1 Tax=Azorhizobium doebereinerae TaxID=281091 RepID=UPI000428A749|nr:SpoIIE family protein phosphatase [Azorhizobium doebereinerae]
MKLFEASRPATLEEVSWLRKALKRQFAQLRIGPDIADEVVLAMVELATNVVRHSHPPAREIGLEVHLDGVVITLTLTDDGGAFPAFEDRWRRVRLAATDPEGGGGRGIAIARAALDAVRYEAGPPNRLVARRQLARRRPQLLVVEDEPVLLDAYLTLLEPDYRVLPAQTLRNALDIARKTKVDLILTDFHLGSEPGTALLQALENDADRPPIPIIMITGDPSVRLRVLELGVDTFLTKPVVPERLLETVKLALVRSARQRARLFQYFASSLDRLVHPELPKQLGPFAAALRWETADIGGGDLVIHLPRPGRDRLVLVDVMGHGINAKAGAVAHAAMVRALDVGEPLPPGAFLARWSGLVFREAGFDSVVATALVVDLHADGRIAIASAGHPRPMVVTRDGARALEVDGPLLGFTDTADYEALTLTLAPHERLLLTTDGLDPAELASGGPCPAWLTEELSGRHAAPLEIAAGRAASRVAARLGPDPQDDWMMVLLEPAAAARAPREALPAMEGQGTGEGQGTATEQARPRPAAAPVAPAPEPARAPMVTAAAPAVEPAGGADAETETPDFQPAGIGALRKAVGEEAFARLAARFLENAEHKIAQWEQADDPAAVVAAAHALAGLLGQFGLAGAALRARAVENEPDPLLRLALARGLAPLARQELALFNAWFTGA